MSPLIIIFLTVFIDLVGFGIIIPLLPFYAETFGAGALAVGLLSTSFSLMQFIFAPVWGRLSDRVGRRPVLLMGLFGSFLAYSFFGLATSLPQLFFARIFAGIAAATIPTAQAFISDNTTPENRAKGMGLIGAAFGLGFIFGPPIGGFLSRWGYPAPAFFAAALSLANFVAAFFLLPESRKKVARVHAVLRPSRLAALERALLRPHLPVLLVIYFIVIAAFSGFETTFALFAERRYQFTAWSISYSLALLGLMLAIIQGTLVGRAARRFGERNLMSFAILCLAVGLAGVALAGSVPALYAALGVLALGMGFNGPSILSLISRLSSQDDQGGMMGVSQSVASLGRIAGPAFGGFTYEQFGLQVPYFSSSALMAVALLLSLVALRGRLVEDRAAPVPDGAS